MGKNDRGLSGGVVKLCEVPMKIQRIKTTPSLPGGMKNKGTGNTPQSITPLLRKGQKNPCHSGTWSRGGDSSQKGCSNYRDLYLVGRKQNSFATPHQGTCPELSVIL